MALHRQSSRLHSKRKWPTPIELFVIGIIAATLLVVGVQFYKGYQVGDRPLVDSDAVIDNAYLTINKILPEIKGWEHAVVCTGRDPLANGIVCMGVTSKSDGSELSKWEMVCTDGYNIPCEIRDID